MDVVKAELPEASIVQHDGVWPSDDDGIWLFGLPSVKQSIQLESSAGMVPFFVEHDEMPSPADGGGRIANSVDEAAKMVIDYLREKAAARTHSSAG